MEENGFCFADWFCKNVTAVIKKAEEATPLPPESIVKEIYYADGFPYREVFDGYDDFASNCFGPEYDEITELALAKWKNVLKKIADKIKEANQAQINPYAEEYKKAAADFEEKYGILGYKLMTEKERDAFFEGHPEVLYFPEDFEEYRQAVYNYRSYEEKIKKRKTEALKEALELIVKYFYDIGY